VDCACGGAYLVGCWGVVQSVGHLTVKTEPAHIHLVFSIDYMRLREAV
jgi:hypothetical protein